MGLSVHWIELVENLKGFKHKRHYYKVGIYFISVLWSFLTIIADFFFYTASLLVTILGTMMIGYSYHYGGRAVVKSLKRNNEYALRNVHVLELANAVEITKNKISRAAFLLCISLVSTLLTLPSSNPLYPQQNTLPRWLQGQLASTAVCPPPPPPPPPPPRH
jgi:hypothetical protein